MKLTTESPFLLPTSQIPPEEFWEQHKEEMAAQAPATLEEPQTEAKAKSGRSE